MDTNLPDAEGDAYRRRAAAYERGLYPAPSSPGRSANMRAVRRRDTRPEVHLASALHRLGYRFRRDYPIKVGSVTIRPDLAFTRKRVAVFVDGCFWHGCPTHGRDPAVNQWYWSPKLQRNRDRDERNERLLIEQGWIVVRLWEHVPLDEQVVLVRKAADGR